MRTLWNTGWLFARLEPGSRRADLDDSACQPILLPHDWLIADTDHLYLSGDGWYLKRFNYRPEDHPAGEEILLSFDGVYMDAEVLLNGKVLCTHRYGYTAFYVRLTGLLREGANEIAVHVRYLSPNSRWYSGAGIYRDVYLLTLPARHLVPDGFAVHTFLREGGWHLSLTAELSLPGSTPPRVMLRSPEGTLLAEDEMVLEDLRASLELQLDGISPWCPNSPTLYELTIILGEQSEKLRVGFRQAEFTPDRGFILNGEPIKLHGVCLHHDLGALGAAFHTPAAERQLRLMRAMGANAIRTAHNPPARPFLDLCDQLGLLVMDELYDMWELPKTSFDNARFFPDTFRQDVAVWIRRDRCHPCVILWSIGNEIYDMHASERGQMWTRLLMEEVRLHDSCHAPVTFGSNYMPWEGAQRCADIVGLPGYNYAEKYYAAHHREHPSWVIYGSETGSLLQSRGVYHFPMEAQVLSEEDLQCSSLLNSNTSWGTQDLPGMLVQDELTPYSLGQFIWAGIDYIGEPTPYHTRSCYFGQADTACFPKDSFYFYQAMWTDIPMVHIGISWDWNAGQMIDVPVMTNSSAVELFLNGRSLGRKDVNRRNAALALPRWRIPFEPGILLAQAYDAAGNTIARHERQTSGEACSLRLFADRTDYIASRGEIAFITVTALDAQGREVENAVNRIHVRLEGPGVLLGLDNGDSTDPDPYQATSRRLFAGRLLIMVGIQGEPGSIQVITESQELQPASLCLSVSPGNDLEPTRVFPLLPLREASEEKTHIRRLDLRLPEGTLLTPESPSLRFRVQPLPVGAAEQPLSLRVTNAQGVDMPWARAEWTGPLEGRVTAQGDGDMYLRITAANGAPHARVLTLMELNARGFGPMGVNPYRFVAGALSDIRRGEIAAGNEQGIAFARDGFSAAGFSHVDFGPVGSDEITIPVFALDDQLYEITLWDGIPREGGRIITTLPYQKKSIWNVYQPETYRLPAPLQGIHDLCFSLDRKVHLKGFSFAPQSRVWRCIPAAEADQIYGDSFRREADSILEIGNNVTLTFLHMDFPARETLTLEIDGATPLPANAITVRITPEAGDPVSTMCTFQGSGNRSLLRFPVSVPAGASSVSFIFLPGSQFDFYSFRFHRPEP